MKSNQQLSIFNKMCDFSFLSFVLKSLVGERDEKKHERLTVALIPLTTNQ